jgi:hypothetical protein
MKVERDVSYRNPPDGEKGGTINATASATCEMAPGRWIRRPPAAYHLALAEVYDDDRRHEEGSAARFGTSGEPEQRLGLRRLRGGLDPTRPRERPYSTARATKAPRLGEVHARGVMPAEHAPAVRR